MVIGNGYLVLVFALIIGGYFAGFIAGIRYTFRKIEERCGRDIYTVVMVGLKENKED